MLISLEKKTNEGEKVKARFDMWWFWLIAS